MPSIIIIAITAIIIAVEIPVVVVALARSGNLQTRRFRVAVGLIVVIFITALLAAFILPRIIH